MKEKRLSLKENIKEKVDFRCKMIRNIKEKGSRDINTITQGNNHEDD
jgi:hypothetical protein